MRKTAGWVLLVSGALCITMLGDQCIWSSVGVAMVGAYLLGMGQTILLDCWRD